MAVLAPRASHAPLPVARQDLIALVLVPVGWIAGLAVAMWVATAPAAQPTTFSAVLTGVALLAAPAFAVIASDRAERAHHESHGPAAALAVIVFFLTILALPRLLVSVPALVIAVALGLLAVSVGLTLARRSAP